MAPDPVRAIAPSEKARSRADSKVTAGSARRAGTWQPPGSGPATVDRVSTGYRVLVVLHLLCVIGGFGAVAYNGLYVSLAQRRQGSAGATAILEVNTLVSGLAEILIYAALVFGVAAVAASHSAVKFSQAWVSAAFVIYLVDIGILHGWIRRHQRRYQAVVGQVEASSPTPGTRPPELAQLEGLEKRVAFGWGAFNLLVVAAVYLMVFKPGS